MDFVKMEGCANDFIVTEDVDESDIGSLSEQAPVLCDRRLGIGADGIVLVLPSTVADRKMRIINADGSEAEMCGNGIRCFGVYLQRAGAVSGEELTIETPAGIKRIRFVGDNQVRVDMGAPTLEGKLIPVAREGNPILGEQLEVNGKTFSVTAVSMGNPHAVIYADELTDELVLHHGRQLESHPFFPRRVNVEFVKVISDNEVRMRVFERGVGETMACGTGACATAVAGVLNGRNGTNVTVHLLGGDLQIEWDGDPEHPVLMTGPASWVYQGKV